MYFQPHRTSCVTSQKTAAKETTSEAPEKTDERNYTVDRHTSLFPYAWFQTSIAVVFRIWPFPCYVLLLFQNESWWKTFIWIWIWFPWKWTWRGTHFQVWRLVITQRQKATRKWPINHFLENENEITRRCSYCSEMYQRLKCIRQIVLYLL